MIYSDFIGKLSSKKGIRSDAKNPLKFQSPRQLLSCVQLTLCSLCIVKPRGFIFIHAARCRHQLKMFLDSFVSSFAACLQLLFGFCFSQLRFLIIAYKFILFFSSSHSARLIPVPSLPSIPRFYL